MKDFNLNDMSDKAIRFFEESDPTALERIFGNCESIDDVENIVDDLYREVFENDEC